MVITMEWFSEKYMMGKLYVNEMGIII